MGDLKKTVEWIGADLDELLGAIKIEWMGRDKDSSYLGINEIEFVLGTRKVLVT